MKYLPENPTPSVPSADNTTSAKEIFTQKDLYDERYPDYVFRPVPIKVSSQMRSLYARIDNSGFSVIPKQDFLSQLESEESTIYALDIVKECFDEMVSYWRKLDSLGKLSKNSKNFKEIVAKRAVTSGIEQHYRAYLQEKVEFFNKEFVRGDNQIKNYADYERDVRNFVHHLKRDTQPFTLSEFCVSRILNSTETGMVIDVAAADPSSDEEKFREFIRDPNYENYPKVAYRFGFKADKNIPWRLYYDLSSEYAKRKMTEKGIHSLDDFFQRYFKRVNEVEFPAIMDTMKELYNSYIQFSPSYQTIKPCPTSLDVRSAYAQGAAKVEVKTKEVLTGDTLHTRYDSRHWIRLYAYFRSVETSKNWTQAKFDSLVEEVWNIHTYRSELQAVNLLESNFTDRTSELFQKKSLTNDNVFDTLVYKEKPTFTF